ncbi:MAG TPA: hypothetical protein VEY68_05420 [Anoxybacillus sp.]|nr:hypothetical protein [Anoxybacillus sp.]
MKTLHLTEHEVNVLKVVLDVYLAINIRLEDSNDETLRELYDDVKRIRKYLD